MVLSKKGKESAKKHKERIRTKQERKTKQRKAKGLISPTSKKKKFIGTQIGKVKVDVGVPTDPHKAQFFKEKERQQITKELSRASLRGDIERIDPRLTKGNIIFRPKTSKGQKVLSRFEDIQKAQPKKTFLTPEQLAAFTGQKDFIPKPISRIEILLKQFSKREIQNIVTRGQAERIIRDKNLAAFNQRVFNKLPKKQQELILRIEAVNKRGKD